MAHIMKNMLILFLISHNRALHTYSIHIPIRFLFNFFFSQIVRVPALNIF